MIKELKEAIVALEISMFNHVPDENNDIAKKLIEAGWNYKDEGSYHDFIARKTKEALAKLDAVISRLESPELVNSTRLTIAKVAAVGEDEYSAIIGNTGEIAHAVINTIKG